jgi:hypothetical protein
MFQQKFFPSFSPVGKMARNAKMITNKMYVAVARNTNNIYVKSIVITDRIPDNDDGDAELARYVINEAVNRKIVLNLFDSHFDADSCRIEQAVSPFLNDRYVCKSRSAKLAIDLEECVIEIKYTSDKARDVKEFINKLENELNKIMRHKLPYSLSII